MRRIFFPSSMIALLFAATPAFAHTETVTLSSSFLSGLLHPLTGFDHLLAMIAFGAWFSLQPKVQHKTLPLTLVTMLLVGFGIGVSGFGLPMVEGGILSSVLILGLLVASTTQLKSILALPLTAVFALLHGFAHGSEIAASIAIVFMIGFVLSCIAVVFATMKLSDLMQEKLPLAVILTGIGISLTGLSWIAA